MPKPTQSPIDSLPDNVTYIREIDRRVTTLEAHMEHLATKNDVSQLKVWILGGVLLAFIAASGIEMPSVRSIFEPGPESTKASTAKPRPNAMPSSNGSTEFAPALPSSQKPD